MRTEFIGAATREGGFDFGEDNRKHLRDRLREDPGARWKVSKLTPENMKQRKFYEGGVVPLATYFHDSLDYRDSADCETMREWLKIEFNGQSVESGGILHRVGMSTRGMLGGEGKLIDAIIDWLEEQNGMELRSFVLNPEEYKKWNETIYPFGGPKDPDSWIGYLVSINKLKSK